MNYIVRIYFNDMIFSADLSTQPEVTIGSDSNDSIRLDAAELRRGHITFFKKKNGIVIKGKRLYSYNGSKVSSEYIEAGNRYRVDTIPKIYLSIHPKQENSSQVINIDSIDEITIGRDEKNDIVLKNNRTSSVHCKIFKAEEGFRIRDNGSKNGTFVNGKQIYEAVLRNRDIVNISIYQMEYSNGRLVFYNVGNDMKIQNESIIYTPEPDMGCFNQNDSVSSFPDTTDSETVNPECDANYGYVPTYNTGSQTVSLTYGGLGSSWDGSQNSGDRDQKSVNDEKDFYDDPYKCKTDKTRGFF